MFRKLVSNLPFSPALMGQIGFYARRLRKEEATRRLGLFMTILALLVQSFTVLVPSTSANGSDSNDMCPGITRDAAGVKKIKACYEDNTRHYRDIMNYFGISKTELWKALDSSGSWRNTSTYGDWYTFGHNSRSIDVKDYSGQVPGNLYARKWENTIQNRQWGWKGTSGSTEFIILADCGNLALKRLLNPSAKCVSLTASKQDIMINESITLTAKSSTSDGAEISKYDFSQDGPGTTDASKSVKTSSKSATWDVTLSTPGTYSFKVDIDTTNAKDNITAKSCVEQVTVKSPTVKTPHVSITKTVGDNKETLDVQKNGTFTYTIVAKNDGEVDLTNVVISDTAPNGISFVSADTGKVAHPNGGNDTYTHSLPSLAVGQSVTIKLTAKSTAATTTPAVNKVCIETPTITGTNPDACDTASTTTPEENKVSVCNPNTGEIIQVPKSDENKYKPVDSDLCNPNISIVKTAVNNTQNKDATTTSANAGDTITFTITATNSAKTAGNVVIEDNLTDALEYATLTDFGGGTYNKDTKALSWASASVAGGSKTSHSFTMTINNPVPSMAQNNGTAESYDCIISNVVSKDGSGLIRVPVACPAAKQIVEQMVVKNLPSTGPTENMIFAGALLAVVTFFWARSRQLGKEVRLVRREFSASTI